MNAFENEFVTVHMRGLKSALMACAKSQRISVSLLVRRAVERELGLVSGPVRPVSIAEFTASAAPAVKLSIRFARADAEQLKTAARQAGLSLATFIMGLLARSKSLPDDLCSHRDRVGALTLSCAELSTLGRSIARLCSLLVHGEVEAAQEHRRMLDTLSGDLRAHLRLAAEILAQLPPLRYKPKERA